MLVIVFVGHHGISAGGRTGPCCCGAGRACHSRTDATPNCGEVDAMPSICRTSAMHAPAMHVARCTATNAQTVRAANA